MHFTCDWAQIGSYPFRTLGEASSSGERIVILSHIPFCPDACDPVCLLWNYEQVVECHTFITDLEYKRNATNKEFWEWGRLNNPNEIQQIKQVLEVLDSHPGTVCAVLSGHDHEGEIQKYVCFQMTTKITYNNLKVATCSGLVSGTSQCPGILNALQEIYALKALQEIYPQFPS